MPSSSTDSEPKPRLSGNTPSLSERIAALQRRNVSGPASSSGTASPTSSSSTSYPSSGTAAIPTAGSSTSAVKERIARLQVRADETPLIPRSSFGAPAPNPDVASHAVRQFPGAALAPSSAAIRPQMTGGAWLNGMPANPTSGPLRPQMTGGMWGNQYYGASPSVPLPRRGPSPSAPFKQPYIHGGRDDAFAELDREAELAAHAREASSGAESEGRLPSLPSAPDISPPPSTVPTSSSASSSTTLPNLPEVPSETPVVKVDPSGATDANGRAMDGDAEIEVGIRAPEDEQAQRRLEKIVAAAGNLRLEPAALVASSSRLSTASGGSGGGPLSPLYQDITDDDDRLLTPGDEYGTMTVLGRSRTASTSAEAANETSKARLARSDSVEEGLRGVGQAAVDSLLGSGGAASSEDDEEGHGSYAPTRRNGDARLASPTSPSLRSRNGKDGGGGGGGVSAKGPRSSDASSSTVSTNSRRANRNGISHADQLVSNGGPPPSFSSPVRGSGSGTGSGSVYDAPLTQSPIPASSSAGSGVGSRGGRVAASDSAGSGLTLTSASSARTLQDGRMDVSDGRAYVQGQGQGQGRRASATTAREPGSASEMDGPVVPRRSASVTSGRSTSAQGMQYSTSSQGRRSDAAPVHPIYEAHNDDDDDGHGGYAHPPHSAPVHAGPGSSSASGGGSGSGKGSPAAAAAARAREAIALARSKSQGGGRLARPPPPGRTLTAAELDASDDDYEPGWASIISRK